MCKYLLLCLALVIPSLPALHAELRTWTSKDGTATLTATFYKADANTVVVILPNGRTNVLNKKFLSDTDLQWVEENNGGTSSQTAGSTNVSASASAKIPAALAGNIINASGHPVDLTKDANGIPEFYLFYYSASWCGFCTQFTPDVVRFAKQLKSAKFSVILVPADYSLKDEIAYMKGFRMPWPGLKWTGHPYPGIPGNPNGGGIPAAILTDANGKVLTTTRKFEHRADFLEAARKIVLGTPAETAKKDAPSQTALN